MKYIVEVEKIFKASQGLTSPIRDSKNLPSLQPKDGYDIILKAGVLFDESQLNDRGWFFDTDALNAELDVLAEKLSATKWTELFDFRPTFEQVARWVFQQLEPKVVQIQKVELINNTLGVSVKYSRD